MVDKVKQNVAKKWIEVAVKDLLIFYSVPLWANNENEYFEQLLDSSHLEFFSLKSNLHFWTVRNFRTYAQQAQAVYGKRRERGCLPNFFSLSQEFSSAEKTFIK